MSTFSIRLFGAIEISRDGQPLSGFRSQKTLVLLAYLISQARPLTRDHLAGLFWPETTQKQALGHLRRALHNLSKNLPGCLDVNRRTAAFHAQAPATVDIRRFEALAEQKDVASMSEAAALLRAPFLEGVYISDNPELESWILGEQERWRLRAITLLEILTQTVLRTGDYDHALSCARRLTHIDPLHEQYHRRLMHLYVKTGQRQAALAQYETCRRLLAEELGAAPSPETDALYQRIRQAPSLHHNLPPTPTPFIGRQAELQRLRTMLANPDCRLITILGAGGVGKTRLALELARQSLDHYLEGVWFVELADVLTAEGLLTTLGAVFELPAAPGGGRVEQLRDYLRDKALLLVLDNFEQLVDACDLLVEILRQAPAVQLLVTSRRPLNLHEEWLFDLDGLPWPREDETENLLDFAAAQLFADAVRRRQPGFALADNLSPIARICRLVQGSPLALEMAAATCREMPCAQVATAIGENLDILHTPIRNIPERHRSVQAVFDYSWRLLQEADQAAYARLSLFRGGFSLAAAETVADVSADIIQRLLEHSLLQQTAPTRYAIHQLLRQYAQAKLERDRGQANRIAFRHAAYFLTHLAGYGGHVGKEARTAMIADLGNMMSAWQWAAEFGQWRLLAQGGPGLVACFLDIGAPQQGVDYLDEAIAHLQAALAAPDHQPTPPAELLGRLLAHKAHLLARSGQSESARAAAQQALALAAQTSDVPTRVEATYVLAFADFEQGAYETSGRLAEQALALARQNGLDRFALLCQNQLGRCCLQTNELDSAQTYFEQTAELARTLPFPQYEITANINLSLIQGSRGHYAAAEALLQQALEKANQLAYHALDGHIYLNLGTMCFHQGEYARGREYYRLAQEEHRRSGNRINLGLSHHAQASVALEMGDFVAARQEFEQALALYRDAGSKHGQLVILNELGDVLRTVGDYPAAIERLQDALSLSQEIGENVSRLNLRVQEAWLAIELGDFTWAEEELGWIEALLQKPQPVEHEGLAYLTWARFWHYRDDLAQARHYGELALNLARSQNQRMLPACAVQLAYVLADLGEWEGARALFAEALSLREARGQLHLAVEARAGLAAVARAEGDLREALAQVQAVLRFLEESGPPHALTGTQEPALIYLACYEVLRAAGEARAGAVLAEGVAFMQRRALKLDEKRRRAFWENPSPHRRLRSQAINAGSWAEMPSRVDP